MLRLKIFQSRPEIFDRFCYQSSLMLVENRYEKAEGQSVSVYNYAAASLYTQ